MYNRLRFVALALLLIFAIPEGHAQKKNKRRPLPSHSAHQPPKPAQRPARSVDFRSTTPDHPPLPQESSMKPGIKKTKKVVIVPAPPPPPGRDPIPPKR